MSDKTSCRVRLLWIEEQAQEYDPLLDDLESRVGEVVVARSEDEGRAKLRTERFDAVLLDLMLPLNDDERGRDLIRLDAGLRLLRELRQNTEWATARLCPVVVLTARGDPQALDEALALIGRHELLLLKPVLVEHVVAVILEILRA